MTLEEFTRIIDLYGAESARWPKSLRAECQSFLANDIEARTLLNQQWQVDEIMGQIEVPSFPDLENRILNQSLPERNRSFFEEVMGWLIPEENFGKQVWRPAIAACIPLVFGIVLGNYFSFGVGIEDDGFQYWDDELAMLSLTDYTETSF
ncbi:MAG: hypothetical protein COB20_03315 [SAR86 cluster bacterium]|uniref:Uncharacterized protein n=1 Tax=SAR86 cluster bacterium TaxID=2030880 RepID=A0A2A4XC73_9GAMM|nr:MAG: hypothetical protein COB20_03315 [SAR86 cluster bacterium]